MSANIDVSELAGLAADLAAAGPKVTVVSSRKMTEIASKLRDDARSAAPVDTGDLRDSIKVRGGAGWRIVVADVRHAPFVEFGTSDTAPQPFLWPQVPAAAQALTDAHLEAGADVL